jgi:mediator of RNA polymerase II transcription subunit 14
VKRFIADEGDRRLAMYLPLPPDAPPPPPDAPPPPALLEGVADAPLVRLYNFLRTSAPSHRAVCEY